MRRPKMTKAQRAHAKEMRALLRLRVTAVRYSASSLLGDSPSRSLLLADLESACDKYYECVNRRDWKRMIGPLLLRELRAAIGLDARGVPVPG